LRELLLQVPLIGRIGDFAAAVGAEDRRHVRLGEFACESIAAQRALGGL